MAFLNRVSVKDINLPPLVDEFLEEFDGITVILIINLFLGYD